MIVYVKLIIDCEREQKRSVNDCYNAYNKRVNKKVTTQLGLRYEFMIASNSFYIDI